MNDQQKDALFLGVMFMNVGFGMVVGIIPVVYGATKGKLKLGIGGFFACIAASLISAFVAVPICGLFVWLIRRAVNVAVASKERKCPSCAELVLVEARICKHCQRELP